MKLVKIENRDIRVGQIRKYKDDIFIIRTCKGQWYDNWQGWYYKISFSDDINSRDSILEEEKVSQSILIGFLGITHRIEKDDEYDFKLVEIPRKEFDDGDVIESSEHEFDGIKYAIFNIEDRLDIQSPHEPYLIFHLIDENGEVGHACDFNGYSEDDEIFLFGRNRKNPSKKHGILGVNYEFVNDKLINNE
jgi:hypothetical protein